jgi:hypothetical protein
VTAPKKPKQVSPGARKVIGKAIDEGVTEARVKAIIDAAFASEVDAAAICPDCGTAMKVKQPDIKKQVETLVAFIEQAEGRPAANQPEATTIIIERVNL